MNDYYMNTYFVWYKVCHYIRIKNMFLRIFYHVGWLKLYSNRAKKKHVKQKMAEVVLFPSLMSHNLDDIDILLFYHPTGMVPYFHIIYYS